MLPMNILTVSTILLTGIPFKLVSMVITRDFSSSESESDSLVVL